MNILTLFFHWIFPPYLFPNSNAIFYSKEGKWHANQVPPEDASIGETSTYDPKWTKLKAISPTIFSAPPLFKCIPHVKEPGLNAPAPDGAKVACANRRSKLGSIAGAVDIRTEYENTADFKTYPTNDWSVSSGRAGHVHSSLNEYEGGNCLPAGRFTW